MAVFLRVGRGGRTEPSAPAKRDVEDAAPYEITRGVCNGRRGVRPYKAKRDGGDGVPYTLCHCEERSDAAIRSPQPKETDSHASDTVTGSE